VLLVKFLKIICVKGIRVVVGVIFLQRLGQGTLVAQKVNGKI